MAVDQWSTAFSSASFTWPDWLIPSAWSVHAPFGAWLVETLKPGTFVELGVYDSFSYFLFCQSVKASGASTRCWAIPQWPAEVSGDRGDGIDHETAFEAYDAFNSQHYASFSKLVRGVSADMASRFRAGTIDLLHIDGAGSYEAARETFETWLPKMSQQGVVLLHRIAPQGAADSGVGRYWQELALRYPTFELRHGVGLGIVSVGPVTPESLSFLFASAGATRAMIQKGYAYLGRAVAYATMPDQLREQEAVANGLEEQLIQSRMRTTALASDLSVAQQRIDALSQALEKQEAEQFSHESALHESRDIVLELTQQIDALKASASWRITRPLRFWGIVVSKPRVITARVRSLTAQLSRSVRLHGIRATMGKVVRALPSRGLGRLLQANGAATGVRLSGNRLPAPTRAANELLAPRILIVAEVSIPQCLKYRVTQKQAMFQSLGYECTVLPWKEISKCLNALQTHSTVIFYRVPAFPEVMRVIDEARTLRLPTFWEVDDIIFDAEMYRTNLNLKDISPDDLRGVLQSVPLYREAMLACDATIASTEGVAVAMRAAGIKHVSIIENALDTQTLDIANAINAAPAGRDGHIRIVYGSGTKTHDADFRVVAPALHRLLLEYSDVRLCIAGELNLPDNFAEVASRIDRLPLVDYPRYMEWLAEGDINIAPLEPGIFNDAKSNIKFLEAATVRLPSVCSPRAAFRTAIDDGITGFLAESTDDWYFALRRLVEDPALRETVGRNAYEAVLTRYAPAAVARQQVLPLVAPLDRPSLPLRVLAVNIYFAPRSFGGATVIAEQMAKRLNARADTEYAIFAAFPTDTVPVYELMRYETDGETVFAMGLPPVSSESRRDFQNPESIVGFREALKAMRPDIVHLHSVQGIGADIADVCREEGIAYAITLHDAWWICGRQFMVNNKHRFCDQKKIDLSICATCVPDAQLNNYRQKRLAGILRSADLLLVPSLYFKDLYLANGVDPRKIAVNKNGIQAPGGMPSQRVGPRDRPIRFGYVGGNTNIKGVHVIRTAFAALGRADYSLVLVDNMLNMGRPSILPSDWKALRGQVDIVPAYTQASIDDFFEDIDVLLFPTQWKESFGLTVREAAIRNVWVVATDAGGVVEDIVAGENGTIIPLNDDGTKLREAIEWLLAHPEKLQSYENPYRSTIRLFDEQAAELREMLMHAVKRPRRVAEHP